MPDGSSPERGKARIALTLHDSVRAPHGDHAIPEFLQGRIVGENAILDACSGW